MKTLDRQYVAMRSVFFLHEGNVSNHDKGVVLENYFNDLYHLFLNKLVKITYENVLPEDEETKLRQLLDEIIKIKNLLQTSE